MHHIKLRQTSEVEPNRPHLGGRIEVATDREKLTSFRVFAARQWAKIHCLDASCDESQHALQASLRPDGNRQTMHIRASVPQAQYYVRILHDARGVAFRLGHVCSFVAMGSIFLGHVGTVGLTRSL